MRDRRRGLLLLNGQMLDSEMEKLQILVVKRFNKNNVDEFDGQSPGSENTNLATVERLEDRTALIPM